MNGKALWEEAILGAFQYVGGLLGAVEHSGHTLMPQRHSGHSHPHPMGQVPSALSSLGGLQSQARAPSLLKIPTIKLHSRASWVGGSISKQLACNMGYPGLIPGSGRSPGTSVVSDSVQARRRQPTRLPRPWGSPGKNTGVGCHCLLQCHGRGLGPRDALKKDSRGLCRGAAGNPRFPRLLPGTLGNFPGCL